MKKNFLWRATSLLMATLLIFGLASCGSSEKGTTASKTISVTIAMEFPSEELIDDSEGASDDTSDADTSVDGTSTDVSDVSSDDASGANPSADAATPRISEINSKFAGLAVEETTYRLETGTSALTALEIFCSVKDIPVTVELTYNELVGIHGVLNGDEYEVLPSSATDATSSEETQSTGDASPNGDSSSDDSSGASTGDASNAESSAEATPILKNGTWILYLNGEPVTEAPRDIILKDVDSMVWVFE